MENYAYLYFEAVIEIIGVNPFVFVPEEILDQLFGQAGKSKGKIPVKMTIDGHEFPQTLVKYTGYWRLYLNQPMRTAAKKESGATATFGIKLDFSDRSITMHPKLKTALSGNKAAATKFDSLSPSLQNEIVRYISRLKTEESIERNILRAVNFLTGKERFVGRDPK